MIGRLTGLDTTIASLLPEWPPLADADRRLVSRHCAAFVRGQIALAPAHIRLGVRLLFVLFIAFTTFRLARADGAALARFASCGPPPFAGLERVLRSMTLLAFLEHPAVRTAAAAAEAPR
jgi:hypothetical protein